MNVNILFTFLFTFPVLVVLHGQGPERPVRVVNITVLEEVPLLFQTGV